MIVLINPTRFSLEKRFPGEGNRTFLEYCDNFGQPAVLINQPLQAPTSLTAAGPHEE